MSVAAAVRYCNRTVVSSPFARGGSFFWFGGPFCFYLLSADPWPGPFFAILHHFVWQTCSCAKWRRQRPFGGTRAVAIGQKGTFRTSDRVLETGVLDLWRCRQWQSRCHDQGYEMSWITHGDLSVPVPKFFT